MTTAFRTLLAAAVAGSLGLGASMASADVDVYAEIDKTKTVTVDVDVDIDKDVDLFVHESIYTDSAAEQLILKNQRNQYNFVEDENGLSTALIDGSGVGASGILQFNQAPGYVNNQANEVSVTAAESPDDNGAFVDGVLVPNSRDNAFVDGIDQVERLATRVDDVFEKGVFVHAELSAEQINGFDTTTSAPGDDPAAPAPDDFVNQFIAVFGSLNENTITGSFSNASGIVQVNQSAGSLNNQNNGVAIALGDFAVFALGEIDLGQVNAYNLVDVIDTVRTDTIDGGSFDGFSGIAQVSQSSGSVNNQSNLVDIAISTSFDLPFTNGNGGGTTP